MGMPVSARLHRLFTPVWAGGWTLARVGFALAQGVELVRQARQVQDSVAHPDVNFGSGLLHLSDTALLSAPAAWAAWSVAATGLVVLGIGGRLTKVALAAWILAELVLFSGLGWELNAPERVAGWAAAGLLLGPIDERDLEGKERSPLGRWFFLAWMSAMYLTTGWMKLRYEPGWHDGSILRQALLDPYLGGTAQGSWLAGQPVGMRVLAWLTIVTEISLGIGVWFRRTNPWALLLGVGFHLGVAATMSIGPLTFVALAAYPVLLAPDVAQRWWQRTLSGRRTTT